MSDLAICIPARNEMFLARTIQDILANIRGNTEIIAVLDGQWANPPIEDHPLVTLVYLPESAGQRAATNMAVRMTDAKYIMKVDAHCAFDEGFDVKLMEDMQPDWTFLPTMRNLHVFDWVCSNGHRRYQGPSGDCKECGEPTTMDIVWRAKPSPNSTSYCFDSEPHFQYFGEFKKRPAGQGDITESMSIQGSCFMISRERYLDLNICDESWGSWGSQGIEVACKSWLSGGKVMVSHKTWYAHCFRTQGAGFGFPYPLSGQQVEQAKKTAKEIFFKNSWEKQIRPLSWLVERFWPVPGWSDDDLARITKAGTAFTNLRNKFVGIPGVVEPVPFPMTDHATPMSVDSGWEKMPIPAMNLASLDSSSTVPLENVVPVRNELKMEGVTAQLVTTDVIKHGNVSPLPIRNRSNKPSVNEPMGAVSDFIDTKVSVASRCNRASPNPAFAKRVSIVNDDLGKETGNVLGGKIVDDQHGFHTQIVPLSKGIVYYTDNRLAEPIMRACQEQIVKAVNGHEIVSVSLQPIDFGVNIRIDKERGYLTMFEQILAGLEASHADIIFFCEHDVLYHSTHFDFAPPREDVFYYNQNVWKVDYETGRALFYYCKQTLSLCAYRDLLLEHYRERVKRTEAALKTLGNHEFKNFIRKQGFEPGSHGRAERVDDHQSDVWWSEYPNIDIRHGQNLTPSRWRQDQFRDQRNCKGWKFAEEIEGWGKATEVAKAIRGLDNV